MAEQGRDLHLSIVAAESFGWIAEIVGHDHGVLEQDRRQRLTKQSVVYELMSALRLDDENSCIVRCHQRRWKNGQGHQDEKHRPDAATEASPPLTGHTEDERMNDEWHGHEYLRPIIPELTARQTQRVDHDEGSEGEA